MEQRNEKINKDIFSDVGLRKSHLIFPIFVSNKSSQIGSMPGISITSFENLVQDVQSALDNGISSIILFGIPDNRDNYGTYASDKKGIVQQAIRSVKSVFGGSVNIVTDVCICQYNLSGHCGIVKNQKVDNDTTLQILAQIARSHAEAGSDMVAPSAMMDGQVFAIKNILADFPKTRILSYSAKHSSSLYSPFRSAAFDNAKLRPDKSSYQVSYANSRQVLLEIETDINEGADMVMIKPALMYLDLVRMVKDKFGFPLAVQNVSGEYAMIKAAATQGWINEDEWKIGSIAAMKRAGADRIISYFALDIAKYL